MSERIEQIKARLKELGAKKDEIITVPDADYWEMPEEHADECAALISEMAQLEAAENMKKWWPK
jgi:hypothetical protein